MDFIGTGRRLAADDFARAAAALGCDEAAVRAVVAVEARGTGWDSRNRPVMLFEPHVLYRNLSGAKRDAAVKAGVAYAKWRPGAYPASSDARYAQLAAAMAIDEEAGLRACSWGLGQVLGENHVAAGFASAREMVAACLEGEAAHLDCMVGFITFHDLDDELGRRDWRGFARGYNGAGYAANDYDGKLSRAYAKALAERPIVYDPLADGLLSIGDKGEVVRALQLALQNNGHPVSADGDFGPMTDQAVRGYQAEKGLAVDGKVGRVTGNRLGLTFWR